MHSTMSDYEHYTENIPRRTSFMELPSSALEVNGGGWGVEDRRVVVVK